MSGSSPHLMFVGGVARPWGAEIALLRLLEGLRDRARITVVLLEDGPMVDRYRSAGAHVTVLALSQDALTAGRQMTAGSLGRVSAYVRAVFRLYRVVRTARPDYVVGNTLRGSVLAGLASRMARRPFVWMARDRLSSDYVSGASRLLFRAVLRLTARGVIANSFATAATLPAHRRTVVLHDPLARQFFELAPRAARSSTASASSVDWPSGRAIGSSCRPSRRCSPAQTRRPGSSEALQAVTPSASTSSGPSRTTWGSPTRCRSPGTWMTCSASTGGSTSSCTRR